MANTKRLSGLGLVALPLLLVLVVFGLSALGLDLVSQGQGGTLLLMVLGLVSLFLAATNAGYGLIFAFGVGIFSGVIRRLSNYYFGPSETIDYVNLLPGFLTFFILISVISRRDFDKSRLRFPGWYQLAILSVVIGGLNPLGAGLTANLATSALLASMLAALALSQIIPDFARLLTGFLLWSAALTGSYVLWQQFVGFPPWDLAWINSKGYAALYIGKDLVRPFGLSSSAAEAATLLGAASAIGLYRFLQSRNLINLAVFAQSLLGVSLIGTRTFFLLALISLAFVASQRARGLSSSRFLLTLSALAGLVYWLARVIPQDFSPGFSRILGLLGGIEDFDQSTGPIHADNFWRGITTGLSSIIGTGSGQLSVLSTDRYGSSELDVSNLALMSGVIGLIMILSMYFSYSKIVFANVKLNADKLIPLLATLATLGQWFNPGCYGMTPVIWAFLGLLFATRLKEPAS